MELRQLRHFLAIVDAASVSRAATLLGKSQQALSKSLQALEESLGGVRLLDRGAGRLTPTAFGRMLLPYARNIEAEARGFHDALAATLAATHGRLRVGASPTAASHLVSEAVLRLVDSHPGLQVEVSGGLHAELAGRVLAGDLDLCVCLDNDGRGPEGLEREVLADEEFGVVVGAQHPLARRAPGAAPPLGDYPWLIGTGLGEVEAGWRRAFELAGLPLPAVAVETSSIEFTRSALRASFCVSVLPATLVEAELERGELVMLNVAGLRWRRPVVLYLRRSATLPPPAAAFVAALHRAARRAPAVVRLAGRDEDGE